MIWALDAEEVAFMVTVVELLNMSHDHSESLEGQSWNNTVQDGGHRSLSCIGNKTVSMFGSLAKITS